MTPLCGVISMFLLFRGTSWVRRGRGRRDRSACRSQCPGRSCSRHKDRPWNRGKWRARRRRYRFGLGKVIRARRIVHGRSRCFNQAVNGRVAVGRKIETGRKPFGGIPERVKVGTWPEDIAEKQGFVVAVIHGVVHDGLRRIGGDSGRYRRYFASRFGRSRAVFTRKSISGTVSVI